jgi:hypothetical protein
MKRYTLQDLAYTTFTGNEVFARFEDVQQLAKDVLRAFPKANCEALTCLCIEDCIREQLRKLAGEL